MDRRTPREPRLVALFTLAAAAVLSACAGGSPMGSASEASATASAGSTGATTSAAETVASGDPTGDPTGDPGGVAGLALSRSLAGLWTGTAAQTPLGSLPRMNMDFRAADPRTLFARVDLDPENNLRFALEVETHGGEDVLVYRNGGYFLGILRDSRTALIEHDDVARTYRFCHIDMGCPYIDALFSFADDEHMVLDVKVKGAQHVYWDATRVETRTLPDPFPADEAPVGSGENPFPTMPSLKVDVQWLGALAVDGAVWVILTQEPCELMKICDHSRSLMVAAPAGASAATLVFEQIHAGPYRLNAILDRNGNLASTGFPDAGDGVAAPNAMINVAPAGESSAQATIVVTL